MKDFNMKCRTTIATIFGIIFYLSTLNCTAFKIRCAKINGSTYMFVRDIAKYYGMSYSKINNNNYRISSRQSNFTFTTHQRNCTYDSILINLLFAPAKCPVKKYNKEIMISQQDFNIIIDPILRPQIFPSKKIKRILLDPGHGGRDPGATGSFYKYHEKNITLQITKKLQLALQKQGYIVASTRTTDKALTLKQRTDMAKRWKADIYISIHNNVVGTHSVKGIETFIVTPKNCTTTYGKKITKNYPTHKYNKENSCFAYDIHKALIRHTGTTDRGIKYERFFVIRNTTCPAILIETGFLSNKNEEKKLGTAQYQQKIVNGIVEGVNIFNKHYQHK